MKIKTKKYRNNPDIHFKIFTDKIGNYKFEASVFKDQYIDDNLVGEFTGKIGRNIVVSKSDGTLKNWLEDAQKMSDFYYNLVEFLKEVKCLYNKNNRQN